MRTLRCHSTRNARGTFGSSAHHLHAWLTLPSCLASSSTPTLPRMTFWFCVIEGAPMLPAPGVLARREVEPTNGSAHRASLPHRWCSNCQFKSRLPHVGDQHQGTPRQPAACLQHQLPPPTRQLLMPVAIGLVVTLRRCERSQERQPLIWHSISFAGGTLASFAQTRPAHGTGASCIRLSQRRPLALTKYPRKERTGSRSILLAATRASRRRSIVSSRPSTTAPRGINAASNKRSRMAVAARGFHTARLSTRS